MSAPGPRSHLIPRTRAGRSATTAFVVLFVLCMPPVTHTLWNRIEPTLFGLPFFWTALFVVYVVLIGVLVRTFRSGV